MSEYINRDFNFERTDFSNRYPVNIVFSLNRACNLRCRHCCLSNEYKSSKEIMSKESLLKYFNLLDVWLSKEQNSILNATFLVSGAEIGMLSDEDFEYFSSEIFNFSVKMKNKYPAVKFAYSFISNLTMINDYKKSLMAKYSLLALESGLESFLATSYDRYADRFTKAKHLEVWENNYNWFRNNGVNIVAVWSITKGDALNCKEILDYFTQKEIYFLYVPVLPTGEILNNQTIAPSYEDFEYFLKTLYSYPYFDINLLALQPKAYDYDKVANLILEQNEYIMIDLLQDLVSQHEKTGSFDSDTTYVHELNNNIYKLEDSFEKASLQLTNLWEEYLNVGHLYKKKMGCYSCEMFKFCEGGIGTFRPVFNTKDKCAGFKNFLIYIKNVNREIVDRTHICKTSN